MAKPTVQVVGLKEANRALKRLPDVAKGEAQKVMDVTAFQVARSAQSRAPRSADGSHKRPAGFLSRSIEWVSRPRSLSAVVGVAKAAFYWKFVEYGTRFMSAKPFLRPSADQHRHQHQQQMAQALSRAGSRIAREAK